MKVVAVILIIVVVLVVLGVVIPFITGNRPTGGASRNTLFISEDQGETFRSLEKFQGGDVSVLAFDANDPEFLLAGTRRRGLWRGLKKGENWEQYPVSLGENSRIFDILPGATKDELVALVLYANRGRIIRSQENERKELLFTPLERYAFFRGWISAEKNILRVVGSDGGFYESRDSGGSWRVLERFREGLLLFETNRVHPSELWVIDAKGSLFRSGDAGVTWEDLTPGLRDFPGFQETRELLYEPGSNVLYHASRHGLLESFDKGRRWRRVALPLAPGVVPVTSVAVDPMGPQRIFVGAGADFYRSDDQGISWKAVRLDQRGTISQILLDPKNPAAIFLGFDSSGK